MSGKDYFILGCKLFGVYCLVLGVPALVTTIPTFLTPKEFGEDYKRIYLATIYAIRFIPIIYIVGGIYLIRSGNRLFQFAYPGKTIDIKELEGKFSLFLKMLGIFLIVQYFPDFLRTISSYFVYTNAPRIFDLIQEQEFIYLNAASSFWSVAVGIYLFKGGDFIVKIGLKGISNKQEEIKEENNA